MSAHKLKPLSIGKSLQDLKPRFNFDHSSKSNILLYKSATKLLKEAKDAERQGNQETSYIYFMKYLNIIAYIQKSSEFQNRRQTQPHLSKDDVKYALESAERLSRSLEERYQEQRLKEEKKENTAPKNTEIEKKELKYEEKYLEEKTNRTNILPEISTKVRDSISSIELYKILQHDSSNVLIMDVRPRNQFSESHIKFGSCISIPEEILDPGCSASKLSEKLPPESKSKWSKRLEVEYLILMDWFSGKSNLQLQSPLERLQTIILEWDPANKYRSKPMILDGGFEDWLNHYPMHCTNSNPQLPIQTFDDLLHIDDVKYPDILDETPKFSRSTKPLPNGSNTNLIESLEAKAIPSVLSKDFSLEEQQSRNEIQEKIVEEKEIFSRKNENTPENPNMPCIDRSSKAAAMQKYKELEDKRALGVQCSQNLGRDREAAESELKKLQIQHGRNELTDKERETLAQNELNLQLKISELQNSQRLKDEENDLLRKELEEYKKKDQESGQGAAKLANIPISHSEEVQNFESERQNVVRQRVTPSTPTGVRNLDAPVPSTASGLKRSRSSPNIAQLIQEPENRPTFPHFDRKMKPHVQKPQIEFINRQRNFHEVYGNVKPGITGLKNLGNSCYMNSILQCMSNIGVLSTYFCNGKYKADLNRTSSSPTRGEIAEEVAHVIRNLWLGQYRSIACRDFKKVVGQYSDQFLGCGQQDAHEFLTFLMDWLHNDLKVQKDDHLKEVLNSSCKKNTQVDAVMGAINAWNDFRSRNESFMLTAFFVQQVSTVQCSACGVKSMNFEEPTSNLTLLLPSASRCTLADCLRLYTSKERISGYKCDSCHGLHDAEKSVDLCRLPPILIIHLKRFYSDGFYQKRQTFVDFPLEHLDMKNYIPNKHQPHTVYDLCAVSNHYGTLEGGHYTAYCKNGSKWYKYDDQDVSEMSRDDVRSASAYILFYAAVE